MTIDLPIARPMPLPCSFVVKSESEALVLRRRLRLRLFDQSEQLRPVDDFNKR